MVEIGIWKPLSIRDRRTTGIYVAHGGAKTSVRPNSLIAAGDKSVLLTHLLVFHSFELTESWTGFLEYGFPSSGSITRTPLFPLPASGSVRGSAATCGRTGC